MSCESHQECFDTCGAQQRWTNLQRLHGHNPCPSVQGQGMQNVEKSSRLEAPFDPLGGQQRYGHPAQATPPQGPAYPLPLGNRYGMLGADLSPHTMPSRSSKGGYTNSEAFDSILNSWQDQSGRVSLPQGHVGLQPQGMAPAGIGYGGSYRRSERCLVAPALRSN